MSGPGGQTTNRDRRRESRREQYLRRQEQARKARQQQIRNQQLRQWGLIGAGAVVLLLVIVLIVHAVTTPSPRTYFQHPATGSPVDNIQCSSEQAAVHYHAYLKVYVDGSQVTVPGGVGLVPDKNCLYWVHVHTGEDNFIHIEAPQDQANTKFTVKNFFDVGGESLGGSDFMGNKIDGSHQLVIKVFGGDGKLTQTLNSADDAGKVVLSDHETVVMLYNSPKVIASPNTDWSTVGG